VPEEKGRLEASPCPMLHPPGRSVPITVPFVPTGRSRGAAVLGRDGVRPPGGGRPGPGAPLESSQKVVRGSRRRRRVPPLRLLFVHSGEAGIYHRNFFPISVPGNPRASTTGGTHLQIRTPGPGARPRSGRRTGGGQVHKAPARGAERPTAPPHELSSTWLGDLQPNRFISDKVISPLSFAPSTSVVPILPPDNSDSQTCGRSRVHLHHPPFFF